MNIKALEKWVKALRSGKYELTTGQLYDGCGSYCALGVLGAAMNRKKSIMKDKGFLPKAFLKEHDLCGVDQADVVSKNDDYDYSFEEMAKHIEETYIAPWKELKK